MFEGYYKTYVTAKVSPVFNRENFKSIASKKAYDIPEVKGLTPDLLAVNIVLASEHENLNGDYFSRDELIAAYKSPLNKPFNIDHTMTEDESYLSQPFFNRSKNTIIGHMVYSALAKKDGTILNEKDVSKIEQNDDPKRDNSECLDVVASAVLYSFIFPKTVADIEKSAEKNQMFVSMECWYKDYDFLVNGEIIERTQVNSKELTERWQNGEKTADGRRICRVLRNIMFGAVAATPTPANPESVFLSTASIEQELEQLKKRHYELHILQSVSPKEEYRIEHDAIEKSVATLLKKKEEVKNGK